MDQIGEPGIEAHMENTIKVFRSVHSEALDLGVKIAIENHDGDMQTLEVRTLTEESGKDFVGSNLDTGSPEERLAFHQEHSKPVMDKLHVWLKAQFEERNVEPNSGLGEAISYTCSNTGRNSPCFCGWPGLPSITTSSKGR